MPLSAPAALMTTDFMHQIFAYQQTKRLHLVIDQLLWSFNQPSIQDDLDTAQTYLLQIVMEAKDHVVSLDQRPGNLQL